MMIYFNTDHTFMYSPMSYTNKISKIVSLKNDTIITL